MYGARACLIVWKAGKVCAIVVVAKVAIVVVAKVCAIVVFFLSFFVFMEGCPVVVTILTATLCSGLCCAVVCL
jgi:hypothetical protein